MFERFTDRARQSLVEAGEEAYEDGHNFLGTEHLLLGLLRSESGVAHDVLSAAGVEYRSVRSAVLETVGPGPKLDGDALAAIGIDIDAVRHAVEASFGPGSLDRAVNGQVPGRMELRLTPRARKVIELSGREAASLKHNYIGTEHILLAILREGNGVAAQVLTRLGPNIDLRNSILEHLRSLR